MISPHQTVDVKTYTGEKVKLPAPGDIPGIDMEVQNYHVPPVGTFHAKYMVVDRKVVILNSNNIQDRVNVEMMTHIGTSFRSLLDMPLIPMLRGTHRPSLLRHGFDFVVKRLQAYPSPHLYASYLSRSA